MNSVNVLPLVWKRSLPMSDCRQLTVTVVESSVSMAARCRLTALQPPMGSHSSCPFRSCACPMPADVDCDMVTPEHWDAVLGRGDKRGEAGAEQ